MRVVIAEDAAVIREGLIRLLTDAGHEVAAAVGDAPTLLDAVAEHRPELAVIDVRMPPDHTDDGLRAAVRLRREYPHTAVLIFSQYVEEHYASELLTASGGVGYLLKDRVADVTDFLAAVDRVAAGGTALDGEVVAQIFTSVRRRAAIASLTAREREVLAAMSEGCSNAAIAERLSISVGAVEKHASNVFDKLGLRPTPAENRRVLAVLAHLGAIRPTGA
ncbi:response regulator transcription factor [Glycomyces salinus]|uniref:response regulator transcription factor n=1 Tax=Glycomyces salinus TaxID=980294 RepID=UPI0018ED65CA|nr:response regulator transcription factor [Glycomyces salinus]